MSLDGSWCFEGTWCSTSWSLKSLVCSECLEQCTHWHSAMYPLTQCHVPADTVPYAHWHGAMYPLTQCHVPIDTVACSCWQCHVPAHMVPCSCWQCHVPLTMPYTHWHSAMFLLTVPCAHWHSVMFLLTQCHVPTDTLPYTRRHESSETVFWESQILHVWFVQAGTLLACTQQGSSTNIGKHTCYSASGTVWFAAVTCGIGCALTIYFHVLSISLLAVIQFCIVWVTGR